MASRTHSKKNILFALGVSAVAIGGAVLYAHAESLPFTDTQDTQKNPLLRTTDGSYDAQKDTDNDGLKDWEEKLWDTDVTQADSDGDGTPDGAEVDAGRNPAVAGPDDSLARGANATTTDAAVSTDAATTTTAKLAREFFTQYLQTRQSSNGNISAEQGEQLATQFVDRAVSQNSVNGTRFTEADIAGQVESTDVTRNTYHSAFQERIDPLFDIETYELALARNAIEGDERARRDLKAAEQIYRDVANALMNMQVPSDIIDSHIELANSLFAFADVLAGISAGTEDPARTLGHLNVFTDVETRMQNAFAEIGTYTQVHGLQQSSSE